MSVRKFQLLLTRSAREDFTRILTFTRKNWGESQRVIYKEKIEKALHAITKNPTLGRRKYGHMMYAIEHHKIYYDIDDLKITVLRILHERMEAGRHLEP